MSLPTVPFEAYRHRAARARHLMDENGIDVLLSIPSTNFRYMTGCAVPRSERFLGLLLWKDATPLVVVPAAEREPLFGLPFKARIEVWRDDQDPMDVIRRLIGGAPDITIGLEPRTDFSVYLQLVRAVPEARWVDGAPVFRRLRCEKSFEEIACLEAAAALGEQVFGDVEGMVRDGMSERELAGMLLAELAARGGEGSSVAVTFGENTAIPHGTAGRRLLSPGDLIVIDLRTSVCGYHADLARVYGYRTAGEPERQIYAIVHQAQQAAIGEIAPKATAEQIDAAARSVIDRHEYGLHFTHRTGHGIGLDGREAPFLVRGNTEPLHPGMVLTIEPGIYLESRFGIHLEDEVLVTQEGTRALSTSPPELPLLGIG